MAYKLPVFELIGIGGVKTSNYAKGNEIANILIDKGLITIEERMCYLTEKGKELKNEIQDSSPSSLSKSIQILNSMYAPPIPKPIKKEAMCDHVSAFAIKYWWGVAIPVIVGLLVAALIKWLKLDS